MSEEQEVIREYRDIRQDYAPDFSIFNEEPDKVRRVKEIIATLPKVDRLLFLMYTDCGSLRKLAARLGISYVTLQKEITRIRKTILEAYDPNFTK
ncbi:MAG: sigma-70 region 4 domain-containing protein [Bacteroidales bacterium]|nr:sigma-70 region 4 domain-containing protein [Bacteroidales bacterium]